MGLVRQTASGYVEFSKSALIIAVTIIIRETECEMSFGKIRLQSHSLLSGKTCFLPPAWYWVGVMIDPALHHRETGKSGGEVWIELDRLLKQRLSLQRCVVKHFRSIGPIVRLNEEQIGVRILGWPVIEKCFFIWRKFRLESGSDFLREIGLNGEYVGQIAVIIFRPNVLVVVGIDQLDVDTYPIADEAKDAFQ